MPPEKVVVLASYGGVIALPHKLHNLSPDALVKRMGKDPSLRRKFESGPWLLCASGPTLPVTDNDTDEEGLFDPTAEAWKCGAAIHPHEFLQYEDAGPFFAWVQSVSELHDEREDQGAQWIRLDQVQLPEGDLAIVKRLHALAVEYDLVPSEAKDNPL